MGRVLLVHRLAVRDLRHRPAQAALLFLAVTAATATLALGLVLHGVTEHPYLRTRAATNGPDLVAGVFPGPDGVRVTAAGLAALTAVGSTPGVTAAGGPYPITWTALRAGRHQAMVLAEGRDRAASQIDQPVLTQGSWVRPGGVVVERSFADVLGVRAGDSVTIGGHSYRVAGIAVTAAIPPYPHVCYFGCIMPAGPQPVAAQPGLVWLTRTDALALAGTRQPLAYTLNVRLARPSAADAVAAGYDSSHLSPTAPYLLSWQSISSEDGRAVDQEQQVLMIGSWLLGLLAVAGVAVLVGGRMADQRRRVGLLKAVGATPALVGAVLLAEHVALALAAAAAGLLLGWLVAPAFSSPGAGLIGTPGAPAVTAQTVLVVAAAAVAVALPSTCVPAIRAARTSTVAALADVARPPRRRAWLLVLSSWLPVPALLGLRLAGRRPRRTLLNVASITVTGSGIVAVLTAHARLDRTLAAASGLDNPQTDRANQVLALFSVTLIILAAVNALVISWATMLDARHTSALARALGATPGQVSTGLVTAQLLPALAGAVLGVPGGIALVAAVGRGGTMRTPPVWWLVAAVLGIVAGVAVLTAIPAGIGARRPPARVLQSETA